VDDPLLPRIAAGDQAAVRECISRYGGLVWSLARRFLSNAADAEDAVQDIFIELWRNAGRYEAAKASESTFVTVVARRRLIDRRRRAGSRPDALPLPETLTTRGTGDGFAAVDRADEARLAAAALDDLREDQRRVLHMAIYRGLTHEEIAHETGMPIGTVKTHVRRGLLRVRDALGVTAAGRDAAKGGVP
jgi:RNA polymerase sigma-70 factor (ECF subfamily)